MKEREFRNTSERDLWISERYPTRKATDTPGVYEVPGGWLAVHCNHVTITTPDDLTPDKTPEAVRSLVFYDDPGHGWLAVPLADLETLRIAGAISSCSYVKDTMAYLEEDLDAGVYLNAAKLAGWVVRTSEQHQDPCPIRNYASYPERHNYAAALARCNEAIKAAAARL